MPPLSANVTNTVGLVPGAVGGSLTYADLLRDRARRIARLAVPALLGAACGTVLLLETPGRTFELIVPVLIAISCLLLLAQPRLVPRIEHAGNERSPLLFAGLIGTGAYAAYFGSAASILLIAVLGIFVPEPIQRLNGFKILLMGMMNALAAIAYAFLAPVVWRYVAVLTLASLLGGAGGAKLARAISGEALRVTIACAGLVVAVVVGISVYG